MKTYTIDEIINSGEKVEEVYDFSEAYYFITIGSPGPSTLRKQNKGYIFWKMDKNTGNVTVSSWPSILVETEGKVSDADMISVEEFFKHLKK